MIKSERERARGKSGEDFSKSNSELPNQVKYQYWTVYWWSVSPVYKVKTQISYANNKGVRKFGVPWFERFVYFVGNCCVDEKVIGKKYQVLTCPKMSFDRNKIEIEH